MLVKKYCSNCGAEIQFDDAKPFVFCSDCGTKIMNTGTSPTTSNIQTNVSCPNCGGIVESFAAKCKYCGAELTNGVQASACQELCRRLDEIEASKQESLLSVVSDFANKMLDSQKLTQTDQKKIELISNFIIPNTKSELLEFIILAQGRIKSCQNLSESSTNEYVSFAQDEFEDVWKTKLEQAIKKGRLVLKDDNEFKSIEQEYQMQQYEESGRCRYCGGKFKGLLTKTCVSCGKPKDY